MTPDECWTLFDHDFPAEVREALLRGAMATYPAAWEGSSSFTVRTAAWLQPLQRHALMRDTVLAIASRFPRLKAAVTKTNPPTTDFVSLRSGQSVLTIASTSEPSEVPRDAAHRKTLAAGINYGFWEEDDQTALMYGILACGPEVDFGPVHHAPTFVNIGIPARDYSCFVKNHSLFEEFPDTVLEVTGVRPAAIQDAVIETRRIAARKGWAS